MATSEPYDYDGQNNREEQKFEDDESPQKLYKFLDKENLPIDGKKVVQNFQLQASKKGEQYVSERREQVIRTVEETTQRYKSDKSNGSGNVDIEQKISMTESNFYAPKASMGGGVQRISTVNRLSQNFQLHQNDIVISVRNPERRGGAVGKATYYDIQGSDKDGDFKVVRSHDDFLRIRNVLVKRWPGCYIPSVPPKRVLTKVDDKFLEGRRKEFEMFVQKITELPHLHYSREYQLFLRSNNPNFEQELEPFQKVAYEDVIMRYKTVFKQILQLRATPESEKKILEFKEFLQSVHTNFKNFKKVLKKTVLARKNYYDQLMAFHQAMSVGYEKTVLSKIQTQPTSVFDNTESGELEGRVEGVKQAGEYGSIEYLHAWMKAETREIGAFLEAIKQKEEYDDKRTKATQRWTSTTRSLENAQQGRRSIKAMLTFKSPEQEATILEGKAVGQDKEQKQLQLLYDYIVLILAHSEIDRFKERKTDQYHHVVNLAAQYELENLRNLSDYWSTILTLDMAASKNPIASRNVSG